MLLPTGRAELARVSHGDETPGFAPLPFPVTPQLLRTEGRSCIALHLTNRIECVTRENKSAGGARASLARRKRRASRSPHHVREATKGLRWMPWRQTPTKDAGHCEKPRGAVYRHRSEGIRMGKPTQANLGYPDPEPIGVRKGTWGTETSQYPEEKRAFPQ